MEVDILSRSLMTIPGVSLFILSCKHKTEVFEKFKLFEAMVKKQCRCGEPIRKLITDNGGEYIMSKDFQT